MKINKHFANKTSVLTDLSKIIQEKYNIGEKQANSIVTNRISPHLDLLKDDIHIAIEYPYIDKVYRDSYYNYYSSKLRYYSKETIKLSFFLGEIKDEDFKSEATVKNLAERYVGFIVLRPTAPMVIGRSVINPSALKTSNFECRVVNIPTTVNSIEFITEGFPHSTQDAETITCAETSLWAIMEYFGHKYVEYKPTLPSLILLPKAKALGILISAIPIFGTGIFARRAKSSTIRNNSGCSSFFT